VSVVTLQKEEQPLTDAELELLFPSVPWRDPIRISDFDGNFGFACRPLPPAKKCERVSHGQTLGSVVLSNPRDEVAFAPRRLDPWPSARLR
jgi:hypothetical protein